MKNVNTELKRAKLAVAKAQWSKLEARVLELNQTKIDVETKAKEKLEQVQKLEREIETLESETSNV